jgi:hypothetical protein
MMMMLKLGDFFKMDLLCCWLPLLLERKKANWVDHLLVLAGRKKEELQVAGLLLRSWWREEHRRRCAGCSI